MGIEPTLIAWKAIVLPLNYICITQLQVNFSKKMLTLQPFFCGMDSKITENIKKERVYNNNILK